MNLLANRILYNVNKGLLLIKAQLGMFGLGEKREVQRPGIRGGKFYRTKKGKIVYGERPVPRPVKSEIEFQKPERLLEHLKALREKELEKKRKRRRKIVPGDESFLSQLFQEGEEKKSKIDAERQAAQQSVESTRDAKSKIQLLKKKAELDLFAEGHEKEQKIIEQTIKQPDKEVDFADLPAKVKTWAKWYDNAEKLLGGKNHVRIENDPYMTLVIEKLYNNRISLMHTGTQNGDLMRDPDVVFEIQDFGGHKFLSPISFRNDYLGQLKEIYKYDQDGNLIGVDTHEQDDLRKFCQTWFKNIQAQGFYDVKPKEKLIEKPREEKPAEKEAAPIKEKIDPVKYYQDKIANIEPAVKMSQSQRVQANEEARKILEKNLSDITDEDRDKLRKYTGRGGLSKKGVPGGIGLLNEYYTPDHVTNFLYALAMKHGFEMDGSVLESSSGTGNFIKAAPNARNVTAVEIDDISSKISKILYPDAYVHQKPFELFQISNDMKFDLVTGNIPFGARISIDGNTKLDMPKEKSADKYFVERCIDNTKHGGLSCVIAMHSVLTGDSYKDFRKNLLKKAEFLGAVRLPTGTFAHTGVVSDVLLFRKRPENVIATLEGSDAGNHPEISKILYGGENKSFIDGKYYQSEKGKSNLIGTEDKEYFDDATGEMKKQMYYKVKGEATPAVLTQTLNNFDSMESPLTEDHLKGAGFEILRPSYDKEGEIRLSDHEIKAFQEGQLFVGMIITKNGKMYILNKNHRWERLQDNLQKEEVIKKFDSVSSIHYKVAELKERMKAGDTVGVDSLQKQIIDELETHTQTYGDPETDTQLKAILNKYRYVEGITGALGLKTAEGHLSNLLTQENIFDVGGVGAELDRNDIVAVANHVVDELGKDLTVDEVAEIFRNGEVDPLEVRKLMIESDHIYFNGEQFQTEKDYLQGDVNDKLDHLNHLIESIDDQALKEKYIKQIVAVQRAAGYKSIEEINIVLRDHWIPNDIRFDFINNELKIDWQITKDKSGKWEFYQTKYTKAPSSAKELTYYLNGQKQKSKHVDTEEYKREIEEKFNNWIAGKPEVRERLESIYNRMFHNYIPKVKDSHPIDIKGINPDITLNTAQWEDINMLFNMGKGISALNVGYGKTFALIALSQYRKQQGLEKKPFFQVPNNKVKDWESEIKKLFPGATVATIDAEVETTPDKLLKKLQQIKNNEYDFVICAESKAVDLAVSDEFEKTLHEDIFYQWNHKSMPFESTEDRDEQADLNNFRFKIAQERANKLQGITFEDLACDALYVDEAHHLKNLWKPKQDRNRQALGLNLRQDSSRSFEAWKKASYIRSINNGKSVFFATATPFTNTALEFYNMLHHIAPEELSSRGMKHIDDFISYYAVTEEEYVPDWRSNDLVKKNVFKDYNNVDELKALLNKYVDFQDDPVKAGIKKPEAKDNKIYVQPSMDQLDAIEEVREAMDEWLNLSKEEKLESGQNALTFWNQFRSITMDLELFDPQQFKGWQNPKLIETAKHVRNRLDETGAGHAIFCDRVFSGDKSVNFHNKIRDYLIKYAGLKESDIGIVNGFTKGGSAKSDETIAKDVAQVIRNFNSGKIKVLLGTTWTLGEGVNIQENSSDCTHLDIPYRPSDYEQRNGRIERQGNKQGEVQLNYVFGTGIDSAAFSMIQRKESMLGKLLESKQLKFQEGEDIIDYMSPLGMKYMTATSEEERQSIREQFAQQKEEKIRQENFGNALIQFKKYIQMSNSFRNMEPGTAQYLQTKESLQTLASQLKKNPQFIHGDYLKPSKEARLFNVGRNELLNVGDHIWEYPRHEGSRPELYQIAKIIPSNSEIQGEIVSDDPELKGRLNRWKIAGPVGQTIHKVGANEIEKAKFEHQLWQKAESRRIGLKFDKFKEMGISPADMEKYQDSIHKMAGKHDEGWLLLDEKGNLAAPYDEKGNYKDLENHKVVIPTEENISKLIDMIPKESIRDDQERFDWIYKTSQGYFSGKQADQLNQAIKQAQKAKWGEKYAENVINKTRNISLADLHAKLGDDIVKNQDLIRKRLKEDGGYDHYFVIEEGKVTGNSFRPSREDYQIELPSTALFERLKKEIPQYRSSWDYQYDMKNAVEDNFSGSMREELLGLINY